MLKKDMITVENYFETFLIVSLILFFLYLIKSYLIAIFLAATFVFLFYRFYHGLARTIRNENVAALFVLFLVIVIILLPIYLISTALVNQSSGLIYTSNELYKQVNWEMCDYDFCDTLKNNIEYFDFKLEFLINNFGSYLISTMKSIFVSVTNFFINIFVFIFAFFFLIKDGDKFMKYLRRLIPMKDEYKHSLFIRFREVSLAVFIDSILIAIVQGALLGVGLKIVGVSSPVFWGTIASFFALIPMVGTTIIWIPIVIYFLLVKNYLSGIVLLVYSLIVVGLSDNIIRMLLLNKKIKIHPFLILISVLGGIEVFGFLGIFLGPIVISLLISVVQLYQLDFK